MRPRRSKHTAQTSEVVLQDRIFREAMRVWAGEWSPRGAGGQPKPRGRRTA